MGPGIWVDWQFKRGEGGGLLVHDDPALDLFRGRTHS
jgi:hypothetical protein